jgi:UrcA family protein
MSTMTPCPRRRGLVATAILSTLASTFTAVSAAADSSDMISVTVAYGDLNVSNPQGAATLYRRIGAAAREVCGSYLDSWELRARAARDACVHQAVTDAVTKVGQPELFAIYNAKNRNPRPIIVAESH